MKTKFKRGDMVQAQFANAELNKLYGVVIKVDGHFCTLHMQNGRTLDFVSVHLTLVASQ